MELNSVSIAGLGLIGGSIAKALRERTKVREIIGLDTNVNALKMALKENTITTGMASPGSRVYDSDIIFICTPVEAAIEYIDLLKDKVGPQCIITDVASTKAKILAHVNSLDRDLCFIGGHPMAGSEKEGYASSYSHMFENAYYALTPSKSAGMEKIKLMTGLIKSLGAIPVELGAAEHDRITAAISHVPHIIASALVKLVMDSDRQGKMQLLAAGGFRDITRIASSNPVMWENIIMSNKEQVLALVEDYIRVLDNISHQIKDNQSGPIRNFFKESRDFRDSFRDDIKGLIEPVYVIKADIVDRPGIIGKIATMLGDNSINIKNICVTNSREFENGCLEITLPNYKSMEDALLLLQNEGYNVYAKT